MEIFATNIFINTYVVELVESLRKRSLYSIMFRAEKNSKYLKGFYDRVPRPYQLTASRWIRVNDLLFILRDPVQFTWQILETQQQLLSYAKHALAVAELL